MLHSHPMYFADADKVLGDGQSVDAIAEFRWVPGRAQVQKHALCVSTDIRAFAFCNIIAEF